LAEVCHGVTRTVPQEELRVKGMGTMAEQEGVPDGPRDELDFLLARLDSLLAQIKESAKDRVPARVPVEEEIRQTIDHLFGAMESIVDWMKQGHGLHPDALRLLRQLKAASDILVQCIGECPYEMMDQNGR